MHSQRPEPKLQRDCFVCGGAFDLPVSIALKLPPDSPFSQCEDCLDRNIRMCRRMRWRRERGLDRPASDETRPG